MWFQFLSMLIATALIGKASIALATRQRFYAVRSRQYVSESLPLKLLVGPIVVGALTLVAWYATIFHYQLRHAICYSCRHSWDCGSGGRKRDAVGGIEQCLTPRRWSGVGQLE